MQLEQCLLKRGLLDEKKLTVLREACAAMPAKPVSEIIVERGLVNEEDVLTALAAEFGLEIVDLARVQVDMNILQTIPSSLFQRRNILPLRQENGVLIAATGDPLDVDSLDELQMLTGLQVRPVLARPKEIARFIKTHFGVGGETVIALVAERGEGLDFLPETPLDDNELAKQAQEASVVKLVNEILQEAIHERASDVHIEPEEDGLCIRYRVDGLLQTQKLPAEIHRFQAAIVSRLKIMARLNIAEKRLPQDGRIKLRTPAKEIDVRVSMIPMLHGEGVVLRILDKSRMVFDLAQIGMSADTHELFREVIQRPHGIILVTGPTGSGKTTTLYSALQEIKNETLKIVTVEDPVEYQTRGIGQIQVHAKIGLTFAASLRSILRHDPDVILIGEIRDLETAESAIQASLTGHLVFSTLHTNDAPSAFTRLIDMGIEPFLAASTLEGVMAQRLVRTICPDCKTAYHPQDHVLPADFPRAAAEALVLYQGKGCRACRHTGYRGRLGLFELMITGPAIRELCVQRANAAAIRTQAIREGMRTLRQDGWRKVLAGQTTLEEVARVTKGDERS